MAKNSEQPTSRRSSRAKGERGNGSQALATRENQSEKLLSPWIDEISSQSDSLEQAVHAVILARPLVTTAVAVSAGVIANLVWQQYGQSSPSRKRSAKGARKRVSSGTLSHNISSSLSRMESEFDSLAFGQFDEMRDGLTRLVADDLKRRPFETLANAVGIGFGLASFDRRHLKRAGLKLLKLAAVRALDSSGSRAENPSLNKPESKTGGTLYV